MHISVTDVAIERASRVLASDITFTAARGDIVGLIGPNGCGKSTLLDVLAGRHPATSGSVSVPPGACIGLMPQGRSWPADQTVVEAVLDATGVAAATTRLAASMRRIEAGDLSVEASEAYDTALSDWLARGSADIEERFAEVASMIGLTAPPTQRATTLSGGQSARLALACILLSRFDVLLLDEPTNNLDDAGLRWLTTFVGTADVPIILVSHDRDFLSRTVTAVVEFDPALQRTAFYRGGFEAWEQERRVARAQAAAEYEAYTDARDRLASRARAVRTSTQKGISHARRKYATGRIDKLTRDGMVDGATGGAQTARRLERQRDRLDVKEQPRKQWQLKLAFPQRPSAPSVLAVLDEVTSRVGDFALGPISLTLHSGDRVLLSGSNGSGKSLLLSLLTGTRTPDTGRVTPIDPDVIGLVDQERQLAPPTTVLQTAAGRLPSMSAEEIRTHLAKFGMDADDVLRDVDLLSWGERTRLQLAVIAGRTTSVLVLDEPTNHVDLPAVEQVEEALADYRGAVILVTHDERLRQAFRSTRIWHMDQGALTEQVS